ncbi:MAG: PKD domain-containing protein [Rhodococcus sp. (in: high G+C Gram-positive bacteria)]|uniref:PKD domain-containing protein n=1 Tax=Rhodococcus sp. TaxID=1831 RepID=UPI002AD96296|nr:PKD domain-containing protein [Rhodococcus sp. (in: high G+C Gram-positive bacteria)]
MAKYRYEREAVDTFAVHFTDLSYYEPAEWLWDFGDTGTSTETDPYHVFPGDGTYEVCLTVSNSNGSDTYCQTLVIGTGVSVVEDMQQQISISIFPNPMQEVTNIYLSNTPK